ncbi:MAG: hypothetical protein V5A13_03820, partial [Haloarculaceae archaeon]
QDRMGVYKQVTQVPDRHRLSTYADRYEGRDIWAAYVSDEIPDDRSERFIEDVERIERRWKAHMERRGRHHALATPTDVERWAAWLVDEFSIGHAYDPYWCRLEEFYTYLQWHIDHPHVYNPVLMAAAEHPAAGRIWDEKTQALKWRVDNE